MAGREFVARPGRSAVRIVAALGVFLSLSHLAGAATLTYAAREVAPIFEDVLPTLHKFLEAQQGGCCG